jgi:hypothetical protein
MLTKARAPFTPGDISRAVERTVEQMSDAEVAEMIREQPPAPPAAGGPPEPPPIEEIEVDRRRRPLEHLQYADERIHEGGVDFEERIAIPQPGYEIAGFRHRTHAGRHVRLTALVRRIPRRRKANGKNGGSNV